MPLYSAKRTILVKAEATYGVDPVPTGAANAVLCRNLEVTPMDSEIVSRDLVRPYYGASEQLVAGAFVRVSFEVELAASGAAGTAPAYDALLKACGMSSTTVASTSVTYALLSAALPSVAIYYNASGVLHKIKGARGNVEIDIQAKQIPVLRFTFMGLYVAPSDVAAPTVDYTNFKAPLVANSNNTPTFSLFSYAAVLQSLNINLNNDLTYRSLIGAETIELTNRNVSGTAVIEAPTVTAKDFWSLAQAATIGALSLIHGTVAGYKVELASARVNTTNPSYTEQDGIIMMSLPLQFIPSSAGNDELTIAAK